MAEQRPTPALPEHLTSDAVEMAGLVRTRTVSPVELVADTFQAIDTIDPHVNAFAVLLRDEALGAAREAERALYKSGRLGPLHGVPVSVKDAIWVAGVPSANGSPALRDFVPPREAVAVSRLRDAGAIIVGKTNNPEFCCGGYTASRLFGVTRNPWNLGRSPGGSSGGAAAAVAAGLTPLSLGSDAGGSIRLPAALCGVVGLKPTFGLIPRGPGFQGWASLGAIGPLSRSVRDAALALDTLAGADPSDYMCTTPPTAGFAVTNPMAALRDLRVGYSVDLGFAAVDPEIEEIFRGTLAQLDDAGWTLVPTHPTTQNPSDLLGVFSSWEGHAPEGSVVDPLVRSWAREERGRELPVPAARRGDYIEGLRMRQKFAEAWLRVFDEVDLLLTPSAQVVGFAADAEGPDQVGGIDVDVEAYDWCALSFPANLAGLPALSVPCGFDRQGLPAGLQIMGDRCADRLVLQAGAAWMELSGQASSPIAAIGSGRSPSD